MQQPGTRRAMTGTTVRSGSSLKATAKVTGAAAGFTALVVTAVVLPVLTVQAGESYCVTCAVPDRVYNCEVNAGAATLSATALQLYCIRKLAQNGGHDSCSVKRRSATTCTGEPVILSYDGARASPGHQEMAEPGRGAGQSQSIVRSPRAQPAQNLPGVARPAVNPSRQQTAPWQRPGPEAGPPVPPAAGADQVATPVEPPPQGAPATLQELAKQTAANTKKQLKKAGKAVGNTVKKTGEVVGTAAKKAGDGVAGAAKKTWNCIATLFSKC